MPARDDEDLDDDRPVRRGRPRREEPEDDEDEDDRPRPRRRNGDATGGLIPYKNGKALAAYYCGIFSLIPCVGAVLAVVALVLGFMGLSYAGRHPEAKGKAHAIVGIVLGVLVLLAHVAVVAVVGVGALKK